MNTVVIGAMMALTMVQQTDTVFPRGDAERLVVDATGGLISVDVWDRDEIRVRGEHSARTYVGIRTRRDAVVVESEARRGPANIVDYDITVPRSMGLDLEGQYTDITVVGADGAVHAETQQGEITISGGRGTVEASSTTGLITIEGAQGRIEIESAGSDIQIRESSGELLAQTAGGDIILENVTASRVDVGSVGGRIYFDGALQRDGTYFFGTHGGSVTVVVPVAAAATFHVATVHGTISTNLEGAPTEFQRGRRHQFDVNGGGALVEAETYGGRIRILRKGTEGSPPAARRRGGEPGTDDWSFGLHDGPATVAVAVSRALAGVQPEIAATVSNAMADIGPEVGVAVSAAIAAVQPEIDAAANIAVEGTLGHVRRIRR